MNKKSRKKRYIFLGMLLLLFVTACGAAETNAPEAEQEIQTQEDVPPELLLSNFLTDEDALNLPGLQQWNPDCLGWLSIENTDMSFPLLYAEAGDTRYSNHDFFGGEDAKGSIYMEDLNAADFSDYNTVIYGRNVSERFAGLHQYQDRDFFEDHRNITVYLEDRVLKYHVFAAYPYDDRHLLYSFDFADRNIYSMYLGEVLSQREMDAFVDNSDDVTALDRIITLSTGVTDQPEKRYLVQAVLVSEQILDGSEGAVSSQN